jgi:hypothetical protein
LKHTLHLQLQGFKAIVQHREIRKLVNMELSGGRGSESTTVVAFHVPWGVVFYREG